MSTKDAVKNIAKQVFGLEDKYNNEVLHTAPFIKADQWECSMGSRSEELYLYRWSSSTGFKPMELPVIIQDVRAYGHNREGEVPYYDNRVLASLDKGYYVLIYVEDVPTWEDTDRDDWISYDVFEIQ